VQLRLAAVTTEEKIQGPSGAASPWSDFGRPSGNLKNAVDQNQRVPRYEQTWTGRLSITTCGQVGQGAGRAIGIAIVELVSARPPRLGRRSHGPLHGGKNGSGIPGPELEHGPGRGIIPASRMPTGQLPVLSVELASGNCSGGIAGHGRPLILVDAQVAAGA
jgi:hypothetical protein